MKTLMSQQQVSPENSIHRHHAHLTTTTALSSTSPAPVVPVGHKVRQCSGGTKRFFVSRVQYPLGYGNSDNTEEQVIQYPSVEQQQQRVAEQPSQRVAAENEPSSNNGGNQQQKTAEEEEVTFRYTWPVRITERLIGADESAILNVSPPFCTAYNGVQFTWLLRICEDDILDFDAQDGEEDNSQGFASSDDSEEQQQQWRGKKVNITLYYKEGPARDVKLHGGNISIRNSEGIVLFENMPLRDLEYTKGGGWSPICDDAQSVNAQFTEEQRKFSEFVHDHIGKQITVRVQLNMPASMFEPMQYLPSIESPPGGQLETLCARVLDEIRLNQLQVPDVQYFDLKTDKYALYRHVFQFACQEIFSRFVEEHKDYGGLMDEHELMEKIRNIFAHFYFTSVIVREAECFEDFLEALDASRHVQFPALRRECERYICSEVMTESADLALVKKMLLLAERFNLSVLKMVSFGVIIDRLMLQQQQHDTGGGGGGGPLQRIRGKFRPNRAHDSCDTINSMEEIREELLEIAEQIIHPAEHHIYQQQSSSSASSQQPLDPNLLQPMKPRKHSKSLCNSRSSGSSADEGDDERTEEEEEEAAADESSDDDDEAELDAGGETLVGSVITQLEELARHIRKVSMPPGVSPAPNSSGRPMSPELAPLANSPGHVSTDSGNGSVDSRRSSLRTSRLEFLQQHSAERKKSGCGSAPVYGGGANSFFTQIYRHRQNSTSSSTDCMVQHPIRDRTYSSQLDSKKNVKFMSTTTPDWARRGGGNKGCSSRLGSSSCSKLFAVRFESDGIRHHREADEDEGVDVDDQQQEG